ncbi:MAG: globin [Acidobacteria bacterium]|nr:globin [Acidobacteriota bacterium]
MEMSLYEEVGGQPFFERLVDAFYDALESDATVRPMYPEDLSEAKLHMVLFLSQYWGGPPSYMEQRGHPRLRMRHAPFRITKKARDGWLAAMNAALASVRGELNDEQFAEMESYFSMAAQQLRNV